MTREELKTHLTDYNNGILKITITGKIVVIQSKISSKVLDYIYLYTNECRDVLSERIYWILNDITEYPKCKQCNKKYSANFYGFKRGYVGKNFCSFTCVRLNNDVKERFRETEKKKLEDNPQMYKERLEKSKKTMIDRYGNHYMASLTRKEKSIAKYGVEHPMQNQQVISNLENAIFLKYGVYNIASSHEYKEKKKHTCLEKYGVEYPMQNEESLVKNQKRRMKTEKLNSGEIIHFQGYENVAIKELLKFLLFDEIKFIRKEIPSIWYYNNCNKKYYPDIFIPKFNKIIEVKSEWSFGHLKQNFDDLTVNLLKRKACVEQGFLFEFWICNNKEILQKLTSTSEISSYLASAVSNDIAEIDFTKLW